MVVDQRALRLGTLTLLACVVGAGGERRGGSNIVYRPADVTARFHDIRHTACTRLLEGGAPLSGVATILGWSAATTAIMAKRYGHIGDTARRTAVAVLDTSDVKLDKRGHKMGHNSPPPKNPIF